MLSATLQTGLSDYEIGRKIRALRLKKKMGLVELGRHTGLSPALLSKIERGRLFPTLPTLLRIALVFGVGLEFFFVGAREKPLLAVVRKAERVQLPDQPGRAAIDDLALPSSNVPHHADAQANMILPLSLVRRGPKVDSPFGVGREVGKHRTHQKRRIVIHGGAKADPFAQSDVKAAANRQRQSGIGMGVSVMDASILGKPCTGEQQHPSCEGICILHI